jgi:uncharacterized protein YecE (DUF72 family)
MDTNRTKFLIGIGGWEHDNLDSCFYPAAGMTSSVKLEYYSRYFNIAEVRAAFWDDSLSAADAAEWIAPVSDKPDFRFTMKLHRSLTHERVIRPGIARNVRAVAQELARNNRLGALLMQFPYGFTATGASRQHIIRLAELFRGFPLYIELRHNSWDNTSLLPFLTEQGIRIVNADLPKVRQYIPFHSGLIGDVAYLRLHGRNEKGWLLNGMEVRYDYLYNGKEMMELRRRFAALEPKTKRTMIVFNNTSGAKAVANALQLVSMLRDNAKINIPEASLRAFPQLTSIGIPAQTTETLFGRTAS